MTSRDVTIGTSLYRSSRFLWSWTQHALRLSADLREAGVDHEFAIVANSPTRSERSSIAAAARALASSGAGVRLDSVPRETLYATWNRIVAQSRASCVTFWNADDIRFAPALVSGLASVCGDVEVAYFPWVEVTVRRSILGAVIERADAPDVPEFDGELFRGRMCVGPFFLFRRSLVDRIGGFNDQFVAAGDFEWAARAAAAATFRRCGDLGGVFTVDVNGAGLGAMASHRHIAERTAVRLRQGFYEHLEAVDWSLVREYLPDWERSIPGSQIDIRAALSRGEGVLDPEEAHSGQKRGARSLRSCMWIARKAAESRGLRFALEDGLARLRGSKP